MDELPLWCRITDVIAGPAGAPFWGDAIRTQLARVAESHTTIQERRAAGNLRGLIFNPAARQLDADVHFLVIAIRNLLRAQEAVSRLTGDQALAAARARFDALVPLAWNFRDFLEHLDAYSVGEGNWQRDGRMEPDSVHPMILVEGTSADDELTLSFGELELPLKAAAPAALELVRPYQQAVTEVFRSAPVPERLPDPT